ncbi:DUF92 domain-containing protein [Halorussus gelatinilyticus]|uniref:DUF92 domain-containing protein n=1 Tax=Halorussus gelatinilyticus TaxID=2937524 RepID=A0A8U0IJD1_9EURY|nr:DUF92 domain-containing protein [Halorussus gelatinilyticus]UPW00898.1 DUF92 domain-containing protein [Halorussus gelatinilyticus]
MTTRVRRAAAYAVVSTLALAAPTLEWATAAVFGAVAVGALSVTDGPVFEWFARPADRQEGRLHGLAAFGFAATGIALLSWFAGLPDHVLVASVLVVGYGNLAQQLAWRFDAEPILRTGAFVAGAIVAAVAGQAVALGVVGIEVTPVLPEIVFLASSGALLAGLLRSVLFARDDPLVMLSVAFLLWLFADLAVMVTVEGIAVALAVTALFGYVSWALDAASIPGMMTGALLAMLTIVLGGYGWFAVLIAFFGIGSLSTKFRYEEKEARGVAEENEGARGSGNVLGNAAVALVAVLAYAAQDKFAVGGEVFLFAFASSIATAMSDTLSSEIGGVFDDPRLITTLERVEPGTDGAVTWQGELAGAAGAAVVAAIAAALFGNVGVTGGAVVAVAGVSGMTMDSLLGATLEGDRLGNQGVNFLATLTGALVGAGLAVVVLP